MNCRCHVFSTPGQKMQFPLAHMKLPKSMSLDKRDIGTWFKESGTCNLQIFIYESLFNFVTICPLHKWNNKDYLKMVIVSCHGNIFKGDKNDFLVQLAYVLIVSEKKYLPIVGKSVTTPTQQNAVKIAWKHVKILGFFQHYIESQYFNHLNDKKAIFRNKTY